MTAAFIISLNDEFGFGKDRIYRLLSKVNTQFECITHGDVTIEDIKLWCIEKGIDYRLITGEDAENGK
jgi:hypothetical protein